MITAYVSNQNCDGKDKDTKSKESIQRPGQKVKPLHEKVLAIYAMLAKEAADIAISVRYDGSDEFSFANYPKTKRRVKALLNFYFNNMQMLVYSGISDEWENSNVFQDLLVRRVLQAYTKG